MLTVKEMIATIKVEARSASPWTGSSRISDEVLQAMARVPRHEFVPESLRHSAYDNCPLPIGSGQTISQPYIVALMTDLLDPQPGDVVLDVGTGSGYQAAVLAELVDKVIGVENVELLADSARQRLQRLGYQNVEVRWGNGYQGVPEQAPFDAILVAAASPHVPDALIEQLKPNGKMIIPIGGRFYGQDLVLVEKNSRGKIESRVVLPVAFVPLVDEVVGGDTLPA